MSIPDIRRRDANDHPVRQDGDFVLYWMIAFRRSRSNFALQHAVDRAKELGKPLVIFEPLRIGYRWASDRLHRFVIEGMRDNQEDFAGHDVTYFPYVEPEPDADKGLLHALAKRSCTVITDDYPCFFLPRMIRAIKDDLPTRLELVDSNGIIPLAQPDRSFSVAHSYRRWMQKHVLDALLETPKQNPTARVNLPKLDGLPKEIRERWPAADPTHWLKDDALADLAIDHDVKPGALKGGANAARKRLKDFVDDQLADYDQLRNHPDESAESGLSPYLHFGHLSAHEVVEAIFDDQQWNPEQLSDPNGKNHGFWNVSKSAEAFLDQMLTWRELGYVFHHQNIDDYDKFETLPDSAQKTLNQHAADERPHLYDLEQFENAQTHDELWNAAQRQIVRTGTMHNYMRMLWGKKILHWTPDPQTALEILIELNNKYGLDGRDPNSYSGIFWVLGRFDRAWGPKRDVFGSVRYMTSDSTRRKLRLRQYLRRFGDSSEQAE